MFPVDAVAFALSLHYRYLGHNETIFPVNNAADAFCVRDAFLLSLNIPVLGEQVAGTIERVRGM